MTEMAELHCHQCRSYCRFPLDKSVNGNVTVVCRNCGHEHYRYVVDGVVTWDRWKSNGVKAPRTIRSQIAQKDAHNTIKSTQEGQGGNFLRQAWMNRGLR